MGLLYYLDNKLRASNARLANGKLEPVVTLTSSVFNTMPKVGKKLLAQGYKLQSTSCDVYGRYTWIFVLQDRPEASRQNINTGASGYSPSSEEAALYGEYSPNDPTIRKAIEISLSKGKFSTAMLQTYLGKGHDYVSNLAIWLEELGIIAPPNGNKPRDILISSMEEFDNTIKRNVEDMLKETKKSNKGSTRKRA